MFRWMGDNEGLDFGAPLVLLLNLTHPFPSTRLAFTSPWCRRLPPFLLIHSLLPFPALSSRTGFNPSSFGWQLFPSHPIQPLVWPSPILAQRTICFRTSLTSSLTSASLIFKSVWVTIPFFQCWAGVQQSSLSMVNESLSVTSFTSRVWRCLYTAFGPILNSLAVAFLAPLSRACLSTSHPLSSPSTLHPTAISPMSLSDLRRLWRVSITFNVGAHRRSTLRN